VFDLIRGFSKGSLERGGGGDRLLSMIWEIKKGKGDGAQTKHREARAPVETISRNVEQVKQVFHGNERLAKRDMSKEGCQGRDSRRFMGGQWGGGGKRSRQNPSKGRLEPTIQEKILGNKWGPKR